MIVQETLSVRKNECEYNYGNRTIPYVIWSNTGTDRIETVIFLGTIQIENSAKWVAESCPPNTAVVQGAPHWYAKNDGSDIPEFIFGFTECAFEILMATHIVENVHVIAESQAAPGAITLFSQRKYSSYLKMLTLLQPLGLNSSAYEGDDDKRLRTFRRRIAVNTLYQIGALVSDKRLRYNHRLLNKTISLYKAEARAQYNNGLKHSAIPTLKKLYIVNRNIVVICGANDRLFPPTEIADVLLRNGLDIEVRAVKGVPHSPLATKYGQRLLKAALGQNHNVSRVNG